MNTQALLGRPLFYYQLNAPAIRQARGKFEALPHSSAPRYVIPLLRGDPIAPGRATLGAAAGRPCFHLQPLADHVSRRLTSADLLFMDETSASALDPGRGCLKKGFSGSSLRMTRAMAAQNLRL
jgi:hypothetical protein